MSIIDTTKVVYELAKKGASIELQERVMELREEALQLQEENLHLRTKIKEVEEKLELRSKMKWEKPFYWAESKGQKDGPYCQRCYDKAGLLMHLVDHRNGLWSCPECNRSYDDGSYQEPEIRGPTIV
ncbi:MAG: RING finger protein [Planctomycetota bacterium]|jgi:ribosomal protein L37AE/L43A